jgi:hypothetical protein
MGTVSRVHTFSAGSVLTAAQLNNEFDNLLTSSAINGGLDATNLGVTAGQITASKALVVDGSRNLDDTTTTNMINNLTLSGTLKLIDDQALTLGTNDDITVKYDETTNDALEIAAAVEGAALAVVLKADQGDDAGDEWKLGVADGGVLTLGNDKASAGTYVTGMTITPHATTTSWLLDFEGDIDVGGDISFNGAATIDTSGNNNLSLSAGTADVVVTASNLAPASNDGSAIGVSGTAWSDLFLASGAVVNFNAGDVTLTHSSNTLTVAGGTLATAALTASTITASGIVKTDDTTDATSTTDGSLQTDGGLSVAKDAVIGDDVKLLSDSAVLSLGADGDATLTHDGTTGVTIAANPITVDSGAALTLDAHTGVFVFKDAGSEVLRFTEGNSGDVTVKLATDGKDLVFTDNGDATNLKILDAAAGINVPGEVQTTGIGYTDGDNAITIADGGGITVPQASTFSAAITVTDTTAPLILKYDAQEYVTHAVSSAGVYSITTTDASSDSGAITLDTVDSITLDSDTATEGIVYADSGTNLLRIHNASSDVVFKPLVDAKDIVFQQYDGNEVCRIADNRRLYLYDEGGEYISSNGTALTIASGGVAWEWPVADGSDGQVLKTDSSGNLDWVSQSSGISFDGSTANGMLTYKDSDEASVESTLTYDGSSQDMLMTSSSTNKPVVTLKNTHNGATGAYLKFVNDKGAAGADNDVCGTITFYGDDDNQDNIEFARIEGVVADASNGDECGALKLYVAENDGNNTVGLSLTGSTTDGEVDATIGAGSASVVTVPGHIDLAGDINVAGELQTANIGYTDGDNAITIADGGGCTFAQDATFGDNTKVTLGTGGDVDISYDGTNTLFENVVGSGIFHFQLDDGSTQPMVYPGVLINNTSATDDSVGLSLQSGTAGKAYIYFGDSADDNAAQMWYDNNTNDLEINSAEASSQIILKTASNEHMRIDNAGRVGFNTGAVPTAFNTRGVVIDQTTGDDHTLTLNSTGDVAHGMTDVAEAQTYGAFAKQTSTSGTLNIKGLSGGVTGIALSAYQTSENSERDSNCPGAIELKAWLSNGSGGVQQPSADKNLVVIESGNATRFIFDSDGSAHAEVEWTTFDTHDDIAMLHDIEATMVPDTFGKAMKYDQEYLMNIGILGKNSLHEEIPGRTRGMINTTKLQMLHHGAIRQVHQQLQDVKEFYEDKIAALEQRLLRLEA